MRTRSTLDAALATALAAGLALAPLGVRAAADAAPAAGGTLRLTVDPPRLLLGRDAGAELRVLAGPDVEDVTLTASAGRVEAVRRLPGGGFAARYRPPAERVPQVAIVAALGRTPRGAEHGWVAIPLSGQGDARIRAAPGAEITLQIGERRFGPRKADAEGFAVIPVVVPPGVREAHHGFTPIDLHVPEPQLLHAVLDRAVVHADRPERVRVLAYVVAPHGAARRGDVPVFEPSRGTVSLVEREPGAIEATWALPPGRAGEERLAVRLGASSASRAVLRVEAVAGAPVVVAVAFDREALAVDAAQGVTVTARALDGGGNPVPAALVLSTDAGELADVREREPGEVAARLVVPPVLGSRRELTVTASAPGVGISGARALPLRPGAPAHARFERTDGVVRSDGAREALLRVRVADRHGNAVAAAPEVSAERGRVAGVDAAGAGVYAVRYVGPAVARATPERLVARVGKVTASAERVLVPPAPRLHLVPSFGVARDLNGRGSGPRSGIALETPAELPFALRRGAEVSWRAEVETAGPGSVGAALLAGASAARALRPGLLLRAGASAGAIVTRGSAAPAGRLALELGRGGGALTPFVEASLLAAGDGAPGAFAALGISAGVRLGLERGRHGHDPHRR